MTLAVDPQAGSVVASLYGHGNYEAFGEMLTTRGVLFRNAADATLIWDAFCEIHRVFSKTQPHVKVNDREWRLGLYRYDQTIAVVDKLQTIVTRTHYMRVRTDARTGRVLAWESVVDTTNERRVPERR